MGIGALGDNIVVNDLQSLMTAEPARDDHMKLDDLTTTHISTALLAYIETRDVKEAWEEAMQVCSDEEPPPKDLLEDLPAQEEEEEVVPKVVVKEHTRKGKVIAEHTRVIRKDSVAAGSAGSLNEEAQYKALSSNEDWPEAVALCEEKVETLAAELKLWSKRLKVSKVWAEDD